MGRERFLAAIVLVSASFLARSASAQEPAAQRPTFVAYPLTSSFDEGVLGRKVGRMLNAKAAKSGRFVTFAEVIFDEIIERKAYQPVWDAAHDEIAAHARGAFDAQIVVWGRIARDGRGYRLDVRALDLRGRSPQRLGIKRSVRVANVHGIVPVCASVVAACAGEQPARTGRPADGPDISRNLLSGGEFATGAGKRPAGWEAPRKGVVWEKAARRCLRFDVSRSVAATTGVICYSDPIPVEPGAYYRIEMDIQTDGPQVIVWAKGYASIRKSDRSNVRTEPAYKHQKRHYPQAGGGWQHYRTAPFRPKHPRFAIETLRVMLYAYLKPGTVRFDNVGVRKVGVRSETHSDEAMQRAFGEAGKQRTGADRTLVGGKAQSHAAPAQAEGDPRE